MKLTPPVILLISAGASIVLALALSGGSLGTDIKWNSYSDVTIYCDASFGLKKYLRAYQTLWASYDEFRNKGQLGQFGQVYQQLVKPEDELWRDLVRILIFASLGIGVMALSALLVSSFVPFVYKKPFALKAVRITTIVISTITGAVLAFALYTYKTNYPILRMPIYKDATTCYPDTDDVSTGFYMASFACVLYVTSAVCEVVIVILDIKKNRQNDVVPT